MPGKFVNEGRDEALKKAIKDAYTTLYLGLYTNTTEPALGATLSSGLTEVSGALAGYARIALTDSDWTIADQEATNLEKTFTAGEDWGNVYGYFIATSSDNSGKLLCVEGWNAEHTPNNMTNGSVQKVTPKIPFGCPS